MNLLDMTVSQLLANFSNPTDAIEQLAIAASELGKTPEWLGNQEIYLELVEIEDLEA